jgi:predicted permease
MDLTMQVLVLFILIVIGYISSKSKMVSEKLSFELGSLVINITLPIFIFTSMSFDFDKEMLIQSSVLLVIAFFLYLVSGIIAHFYIVITKHDKLDKAIYEYILIFPNVGYMGYPIMASLYGSVGVFYAAIFNIPFNLFVWSYGIYLMRKYSHSEQKPSRKERLKATFNPGLVSVILGFTFFLFSLKLPEPIDAAFKLIGDSTTPLSMMVIGFILSTVSLKDIALDYKLYVGSIVRLIVIPLLFYLMLNPFFDGIMLEIPVLLFAMPGAVNTAIIAQKYENNYVLASKLVFISTMLSVVTIPFIIKLIVV